MIPPPSSQGVRWRRARLRNNVRRRVGREQDDELLSRGHCRRRALGTHGTGAAAAFLRTSAALTWQLRSVWLFPLQ